MAVIEINKENFEQEVLQANGKVLVDFYADWCGPCKALRPMLEEVASENESAKIVSVNIDDEEGLAEEYNVSSIPCLVLFDGGVEVKRSVGLISKDEIETIVGAE